MESKVNTYMWVRYETRVARAFPESTTLGMPEEYTFLSAVIRGDDIYMLFVKKSGEASNIGA